MTSLASPTKRSRKNLQPIDESGESFVESQAKFLDKTHSEVNKAGNHQSPTTQKQRRSYNSSIKTYQKQNNTMISNKDVSMAFDDGDADAFCEERPE